MATDEQPLSLAELIDLECQLLADEELDRQTLFERDRALGEELFGEEDGAQVPARHAVFRAWLETVCRPATVAVGHRVEAVYRLAGIILAAVGLVSGAGTAATLLRYDGTQPVNIVHFLAVFIVLQLLLLGLPLLHMLPRSWLRWAPGFGPLHELLRGLGYRQAGVDRLLSRLPGQHERLPLVLGQMRSWSTIYADVERWTLLALTQRVGVFFNIGALCTCTYLIAVTDLAFAWSTTLSIDTPFMTRLLQLIALPWFWLPVAVPTDELVEASRYFRQSGHYDPVMLKDWWAFLVAALLTYGLLPRLALWGVAGARARRARAALPLNHGDCEAVYERLMHGARRWSAERSQQGVGGDDAVAADRGVVGTEAEIGMELPTASEVEHCAVVCWADVPLSTTEAAELVRRRFGWPVDVVHAVGGKDARGQHKLLASLGGRTSRDPVVVVAEAWESPGKAVARLVREIRNACGPARPVVVGLVAGDRAAWTRPTDTDRGLWVRAMRKLGDPYLRVEDLAAA